MLAGDRDGSLWMLGLSATGDSLWSLTRTGFVMSDHPYFTRRQYPILLQPRRGGGVIAALVTTTGDSAATRRLALLWISAKGKVEHEATLLVTADGNIDCAGLAVLPEGSGLVAVTLSPRRGFNGPSWLLAADTMGTIFVRRELEDYSGGFVEYLAGLADGTYLTVGRAMRKYPASNWNIAKRELSGRAVWSRNKRDGGYNCYDFLETADHRYILAGDSAYHGWLCEVDADGDSLQMRQFPVMRQGEFRAVIPGPRNQIVLFGNDLEWP